MPKQSTLELAKEISETILNAGGTYKKNWFYNTDPGFKETVVALEKAEGLTKFAQEEQRVDEIIKRVIEKNRAILIELIKQENALVKEEEQALAAVQKLKEFRKQLLNEAKEGRISDITTLQKALLQINIIKNLL